MKKLTIVAVMLSIFFSMNIYGQDRVTVNRSVRFARGANSTTVKGRVVRGTSHIYRITARAGQQMAVVLKTGNQTSLTVSGWNSGILEGTDGVREAVIELPETGEYTIQIGTDVTASYTLEITIE